MPMSAVITSRSNARVKVLRAALSGKSSLPGEMESVFVRQGSESLLDRPPFAAVSAREVVLLSADVFASAVETNSPQGIAATLRIPVIERPASPEVTLLLEDLQDPGNVGTLLRSAEAFGCGQVMITPGTANPWSPKVMRASAGSVFRMPVLRASLAELSKLLRRDGLTIYAAVVKNEGSVPVMEVAPHMPCALLIGNEGAGLSPAALAMADHRVTIPCAVESLNAAVAGSLLLYEAMRVLQGAAVRQEAVVL
jgi:TrmH family RNA methyltransferase